MVSFHQHVNDDCTCPFHTFEDAEEQPVTATYSEGGIPFIVVSGSSVKLVRKSLTSEGATPPAQLVAISHVRSQGLGNWHSNALALCQLSRLQKLADNVYPQSRHHIPFWIDTACIPLTQPGNSLALEALGHIYKNSDTVLVLDTSLVDFTVASPKENLLEIKDSAWAKRLWTIREGALAKALRVQFKDDAIDLDDTIGQFSKSLDQSLVSWTTSVRGVEGLPMTEERNAAFVDICLMLERDLRAAIGKTLQLKTAFEEADRSMIMQQKQQLRTIIRQCYFSTLRYRYFWGLADSANFEVLRQIIEGIYAGISYDELLKQQEISLEDTFKRLFKVYSMTKELVTVA